MCIALFFAGFFLGPLMILPMQEMMVSTKLKFPDYDFEHSTNLLSGVMNSAVGVGQAIGPIFGASMYQVFGFRTTEDVTAAVIVLIGILYLLFADGFRSYTESCANFS